MKAGYSLWISNEQGNRIFGLGPYNLLLLIDELGSLNKAAMKMKMSYTKARDILNRAEEELDIKLLNREIGGVHGGGSTLTEEAKDLMNKYDNYRKTLDLEINRLFAEIFCKNK